MFNINKLIIVLVLFGFSSQVYSQEKLPRKLKKLGLTTEDVVYSNEKLTGYPKGLIYEVNKPDSVYYFGCLGSDAGALTDYFDKQEKGVMIGLNDTIKRILGDYTDNITFKSLPNLTSNFKDLANKNVSLNMDQIDMVLLYYWCKDVFIVEMKNNLKTFKQFVNEHPEKRIRFLAVCTDKSRNMN